MGQKVCITRQAVIMRVNRKLAKDNRSLKKNRSKPDNVLGEYFVVDLMRNAVMSRDVDVEELARKIGALKPYESMEE